MQFPIRSTNERKLRSRYGTYLLRQASSGVPQQRKPIYERLATLASLTGLVVGFVAALGFPAATLQFTHLGIPTEMLSYGRSLRAGIMPTAALIIGSIVLLGVGKMLGRNASKLSTLIRRRSGDQTDSDDAGTGILTYIGLPFLLIFMLWGLVFAITTFMTLFWWPFVISRYIASNFGFIWGLASFIFIVVVAPGIFVRWTFSRATRREKMSKQLSKERATEQDAFELPFLA
jgi:hypothetical protein